MMALEKIYSIVTKPNKKNKQKPNQNKNKTILYMYLQKCGHKKSV
jgi:hypothetical protein